MHLTPDLAPFSVAVRGAEINKSYLDNNRSDMTLGDMSTWFCAHQQQDEQNESSDSQMLPKTGDRTNRKAAIDPIEFSFETEMQNFKDLLYKIREIMDGKTLDRCSD